MTVPVYVFLIFWKLLQHCVNEKILYSIAIFILVDFNYKLTNVLVVQLMNR